MKKIAIVGSRRMTSYGKEVINQLKQWGGKSTLEIQGIEEKVVFSLPKGLQKEKDLSAH